MARLTNHRVNSQNLRIIHREMNSDPCYLSDRENRAIYIGYQRATHIKAESHAAPNRELLLNDW